MYGVFLNPSSASAEKAGVILVFGLAAFGLLLLFNAYQRKRFQKGGGPPHQTAQNAPGESCPCDGRRPGGRAAHHGAGDVSRENLRMKKVRARKTALSLFALYFRTIQCILSLLCGDFVPDRSIKGKIKTVTIYTDGGTAHRAGVRMSGRLAPIGATGVHGQQAPSEGGLT